MHGYRLMIGVTLLWIVGFTRLAGANHVVEMSLPQLADYAGQVIEGEVESIRSYWIDQPRRIESEITFTNVQYHKGALDEADGTFTLRVPGGRIGDWQMRLCCAPQFEVGQRWMLMLLPTYKTYPVVGLYQGAFEIRADGHGGETLHQGGRGMVTHVDDDGFVRCATPVTHHRAAAERLSAEPAAVVIDVDRPAEARPMNLDAFRTLMRQTCAASRSHDLNAPAGQPNIPHLRAVPLQSVDDDRMADAPQHLRSVRRIERDQRRSTKDEKPDTRPTAPGNVAKEVQP
jgi:hypothetical protein